MVAKNCRHTTPEVPPAWHVELRVKLLGLLGALHPTSIQCDVFVCFLSRLCRVHTFAFKRCSKESDRHLNLETFAFLLAFRSNHALDQKLEVGSIGKLKFSYQKTMEEITNDNNFGAVAS